MPRRPRPAHRQIPGKVQSAPTRVKDSKPKVASKIPSTKHDSDNEGDGSDLVVGGSSSDEFEEGSSQGSITRHRSEESGDDDDADASRIVQWAEDDENYEDSEDEKEVPAEETLKNDLQDLPLGVLRQAQHVLHLAEPETDSERDIDSDSEVGPESHDTKGKKKEKVEWSAKPRTDISKRSNKHAPTEVTSKRPVTRKRTVVEFPKIVPRDPRFLPTAGEFSADKFQTSYGFLANNHKKELDTLRETLKQARKLLASSPRDLLSERENEVYRLEQAVKRAESMVNRDRLQQVEREALGKVKKEEQQKRTQGKREWWMKKGEKQKVVVQARYEALAKEGGQRAVKKAIEKKQKKESQKEKRSRPYAKGECSTEPPAKRRRQ